MRVSVLCITAAAAFALSSGMAHAQTSLPNSFVSYGPPVSDVRSYDPIEPRYAVTEEGFVRDGDRVALSLGTFELERTRLIHHPFEAMKIRHERLYLDPDHGDGSARMHLWRSRERQNVPYGAGVETYGVAFSWQF